MDFLQECHYPEIPTNAFYHGDACKKLMLADETIRKKVLRNTLSRKLNYFSHCSLIKEILLAF